MSLPPEPRRSPLAQTLRWSFRPLAFMQECRRLYGDSFSVRFLGFERPMVLISDPAAIKALYTERSHGLPPGRNIILEPILGSRSLLLQEGAEHLSRRRLMLPAFHGDGGRIRGERGIEAGGHARRQVLPHRAGREQNRVVARGRGRGHGARERLGQVLLRQRRRFADQHAVGAAAAQLGGHGASARTDQHGVHLAAQRVRHLPGRRHHLEREATQLAVALLNECENVGRHQSTFACSLRSRTSSGTASGPCPTIRPAGRSGGGIIAYTSIRPGGSCAGFSSSGFFLAAMIPLSDG